MSQRVEHKTGALMSLFRQSGGSTAFDVLVGDRSNNAGLEHFVNHAAEELSLGWALRSLVYFGFELLVPGYVQSVHCSLYRCDFAHG